MILYATTFGASIYIFMPYNWNSDDGVLFPVYVLFTMSGFALIYLALIRAGRWVIDGFKKSS